MDWILDNREPSLLAPHCHFDLEVVTLRPYLIERDSLECLSTEAFETRRRVVHIESRDQPGVLVASPTEDATAEAPLSVEAPASHVSRSYDHIVVS